MKKSMKKLLGAVLTVAMCLALVPAQAAKAEETVDFTTLTEEQLKEILLGTWVMSEGEEVTFDEKCDLGNRIAWLYAGISSGEKTIGGTYTDNIAAYEAFLSDRSSQHKELYFWMGRNEEGNVEAICSLYECGGWGLDIFGEYNMEYKILEDGQKCTPEEVFQKAITIATNTEAPKTEVPKQEDTKTEASGRELLEGESVYVVKKGDCLWSIARNLLGSGYKYKELFTRNGDIIKKATEIFEGQNIIIPAK